jgi:hypothetical protein
MAHLGQDGSKLLSKPPEFSTVPGIALTTRRLQGMSTEIFLTYQPMMEPTNSPERQAKPFLQREKRGHAAVRRSARSISSSCSM